MKLATLCLVLDGEYVIFIHRNKDPEDIHYMMHTPPGGKVEEGETPEFCVSREIKEEIGCTLKDIIYRGIVTFDNRERLKPNGQPFNHSYYVFVYEAQLNYGDLKKSNDEGDVLRVHKSSIESLSMHQGDRSMLNWIKEAGNKNKIFSGYIKLSGMELSEAKAIFY